MNLRCMSVVLVMAAYAPLVCGQGDIVLIAPGGIRSAMDQLMPGYEQKSGYKVKATFGSGVGTRQQIARGQACDVAIVQQPYEDVIASGNVVANTETPLASIVLGIAVHQGAPRPSIDTAASVKRTLLAAKSVVYPDAKGAAAGVKFDEVLQTLGIAAEIEAKLKRASTGAAAMQSLARGEAEIGVTFVSEMNVPGIDVVGALPKDIDPPIRVVGFVSSHAKDPATAKAFLQYFSSPDAVAVYKAKGMMASR